MDMERAPANGFGPLRALAGDLRSILRRRRRHLIRWNFTASPPSNNQLGHEVVEIDEHRAQHEQSRGQPPNRVDDACDEGWNEGVQGEVDHRSKLAPGPVP
jgi:hypothetical protein